jgi:hypothetical protein
MNTFPKGGNWQSSMDLRDYFAAKAMQSLILKSPLLRQGKTENGETVGVSDEDIELQKNGIAAGAYSYADAMIKMRGAE